MECSILATIEVAVLLMVTTCAYVYWKYRDFPPGPWGIPFLGYSFFLGAKPHATLRNLSKKYGPIVSVNIGNEQTVVVNDWEGIREVLIKQGDAFSRRPYVFTFKVMLQGRDNDIATTSGPVTKELKQISTKIMKNLGLGRSSLESVIVAEVEKLAAHLKTLDGQLVDMNMIFFIPIMNIVWGMTSGEAFDVTDPAMKSLADAIHTIGTKGNVGILNLFPPLRFIIPELTGYTRFSSAANTIMDYIDKVVEEHLKEDDGDNKADVGQSRKDFLHSFNEEIKIRKKDNKDQPPYCKNNLAGVAYDMLIAGIETMDTTLFWSCLLMAYHPHIQQKVQQEVDEAFGKDSHLSYSSKTMIPYTEATLCEVQRFASVFPLSLPHCAAKGATVLGRKIPEGTTVIANLWALHHDEEYWGDPDKFRPERFLNEEGRLIKHERFIPFSAGPRVCLGEPLAKMELTLFFSCLMRRFSFHMDPSQPISESVLEPLVGIVLRPHPIWLIVKCR